MAHPPPPPLPYRAAIMQSQAAETTNWLGPGRKGYDQILDHYNCSFQLSPIDCLRNVSAMGIKNFTSAQQMKFGPVEDHTTQTNNVVQEFVASRKFVNVPFLLGSNLNETTFLTTFLNKAQNASQLRDKFLNTLAPQDLARQNEVMAQYPQLGQNSDPVKPMSVTTYYSFI